MSSQSLGETKTDIQQGMYVYKRLFSDKCSLSFRSCQQFFGNIFNNMHIT